MAITLRLKGLYFFLSGGFWLLLSSAAAQTTVSGTVTSAEDQLPVIGVSVVVVGTQQGVTTDFDGHYSIDVAPDAVLQFNYTGFVTKTENVNGRTIIDVVMETDEKVLED